MKNISSISEKPGKKDWWWYVAPGKDIYALNDNIDFGHVAKNQIY